MAQDGQQVLVAYFADVRHFVSILRTVAFKPVVTMSMQEAGLCFSSQDSHVLQAKAYVPCNVFTSYAFNPPADPKDDRGPPSPGSDDSDAQPAEDTPPQNINISINLSHLLECLDIFRSSKASVAGPTKKDADEFGSGFKGKAPTWADDDDAEDENDDSIGGGGGWNKSGKGPAAPQKSTSARITWEGKGEQLEVVLEEQGGGPKTTCRLSTSDSDENDELDFLDERDEGEAALWILLQSDHLKRQLQSLEPSSDRITLSSRAPGVLPHQSYSGSSSSVVVPKSSARKRTQEESSSISSSRQKKAKSTDAGADFLIEADGTFSQTMMLTSDRKPHCIQLTRRVDHIKHTYKKRFLLLSLRALGYSLKTSLSLHISGLFVLQIMMAPPPPSLDPRAMGEEEKVKRKMEETRRKEGDINDGIVEFQMMCLSPEDDEDQLGGDGPSD